MSADQTTPAEPSDLDIHAARNAAEAISADVYREDGTGYTPGGYCWTRAALIVDRARRHVAQPVTLDAEGVEALVRIGCGVPFVEASFSWSDSVETAECTCGSFTIRGRGLVGPDHMESCEAYRAGPRKCGSPMCGGHEKAGETCPF